MIEVFKTNVSHQQHADMLCSEIEENFNQYEVNFDLDDCDKILRIKSVSDIQVQNIIDFLDQFGFEAEVLPDDCPVQNIQA